MINTIGPNTVFVQRFGIASFGSGKDFKELMKRPTLNLYDVRAIEEEASTLRLVDVQIGGGGRIGQERVFYKNQHSKRDPVGGTGDKFARVSFLNMQFGRYFNENELQHRRSVIVLGQGPFTALFKNEDPIGKLVRVGKEQFEVIGVFEKRPGLGGLNTDPCGLLKVCGTVSGWRRQEQ
jgi:putative ABC transport system permease protein